MLSINTNHSSLIAQNSMKTSTNKLNQAIERMTTGAKINHAKDNAANYSINTNLTTKISAYDVAADNVAMGMDMVSTAEETLSEIQNKLSRLRALQEQASNGTYGGQSLKAINTEVNALVDEIERLYATAEYNGIKLFEGKKEEASFINEVTERDTTNMTTLASVTDETQPLAADTYSISTPEELKKLARITNSGNLTDGCEFVLAKDIDLSSVSNWTPIGDGWDEINQDLDSSGANIFKGTFDGNGHVIKNLKTDAGDTDFMNGLFGAVSDIDTTIKNLGIENADVNGGYAGALVGCVLGISMMSGGDVGLVNVENCYSTGKVSSTTVAGGLVGAVLLSSIDVQDCWSAANIVQTGASDGETGFGGFVGFTWGYINADNCHALGDVTVIDSDPYINAGGFVGLTAFEESMGIKISNSSSSGKVTAPSSLQMIGGFIGFLSENYNGCIENCYYNNVENSSLKAIGDESNSGVSYTLEGKSRSDIEKMLPNYVPPKTVEVGLQVGIYGTSASNLQLETSFVLENLADVRNIGANDTSYLVTLDNMLKTVSGKLTEFGSVSNRLDSVLDEILIQQDNLVASRSTIRDADIAEVSSQYIQQQILQQASATLLASTKNIQYQNVLGLLQSLQG